MPCTCSKCGKPTACGEEYCEQCLIDYYLNYREIEKECERFKEAEIRANETVYERELRYGKRS
ncbi:MAG TPA: hypothetical protein VMW45_00640 [Dehalococcoidia bacterium]|nr:hypothetical protein [Dehalococcoidia bacterium]